MCSKAPSKLVSLRLPGIVLFNSSNRHVESELLHIHRQSAYLIGRDRAVADILVEHPSCSKQHAAIQCQFFFACLLPPITNPTFFRPICSGK